MISNMRPEVEGYLVEKFYNLLEKTIDDFDTSRFNPEYINEILDRLGWHLKTRDAGGYTTDIVDTYINDTEPGIAVVHTWDGYNRTGWAKLTKIRKRRTSQ